MTTMSDLRVLGRVLDERVRQDKKWGEQNHLDGTGPTGSIVADMATGAATTNEVLETRAKSLTDSTQSPVTWTQIATEEWAEALACQPDSTALRAEVTQLAAVCFGWLGAMERRHEVPRRVYISGPIASDPETASERFAQAAERVKRATGCEVVNAFEVEPVNHGEQECPEAGYFPGTDEGHQSSCCYMRTDLLALLTCDSIYLMDGWQSSQGARLELMVAQAIGLEVLYETEPERTHPPSRDEQGRSIAVHGVVLDGGRPELTLREVLRQWYAVWESGGQTPKNLGAKTKLVLDTVDPQGKVLGT